MEFVLRDLRLAVGADRGDVLKLVMVHGAKLALGGVVLGLLGAAALSRIMASQLYGVEAIDPSTFALVAVVLSSVAMVATYIPAHRAARIDPMTALQAEGR
jgi:ABC-type antimicrobial peptide transport system permease subunit